MRLSLLVGLLLREVFCLTSPFNHSLNTTKLRNGIVPSIQKSMTKKVVDGASESVLRRNIPLFDILMTPLIEKAELSSDGTSLVKNLLKNEPFNSDAQFTFSDMQIILKKLGFPNGLSPANLTKTQYSVVDEDESDDPTAKDHVSVQDEGEITPTVDVENYEADLRI